MLIAVLATVFVPFAAVLLGKRSRFSLCTLSTSREERVGVLDCDLDQAVRLNIGVLAAGDSGYLNHLHQLCPEKIHLE